VHNIHVMLNKALGDAARKGTVVRNVVALADAPSLRARKRAEIKAWEIYQLATFLDAISSHRLAPAFFLLAAAVPHLADRDRDAIPVALGR
jgi:hypothetical protein